MEDKLIVVNAVGEQWTWKIIALKNILNYYFMNKISLGGRGHKGLYKTQEMPGTKHKRIPDSSWNQSALGLAQDTRQPSVNQIISSPYLYHLLLWDVRVVILMTRSVLGDDDHLNDIVIVFSCPGQLNRWPCHSLTQSVTFWFQLQ